MAVLHSLSACAECSLSGPDFVPDDEAYEVTGEFYCGDCAPAQIAQARYAAAEEAAERSMGPDHSRSGIFVYHNCSYCRSGELPCREGSPSRCSNPMARND